MRIFYCDWSSTMSEREQDGSSSATIQEDFSALAFEDLGQLQSPRESQSQRRNGRFQRTPD